jgi:hypothetical protein
MEIQNIVQIINRAIKINKPNKNRIKRIMQLLQNNKN